jgi:L-asparaginase
MKIPDILIIYTGGTIGMMQNPATGELSPFNFDHLMQQMPELHRIGVNVHTHSFRNPVDSSNMTPELWQKLAKLIVENESKYNGFVVLHGTDTMSYTASALSFMLAGLSKPVIFTGSQLPMGIIRTDGKENFITAVEIAAACYADGEPVVQEVAVYFEYRLYRGNRTTKVSASHFDAFASPNYPVLAEAGVDIQYNREALLIPEVKANRFRFDIDTNVAVIRVFPGITEPGLKHLLSVPGLRGAVIETYGAGNAPSAPWFLNALQDAIQRGIVLVNITQCLRGHVDMTRYATGVGMQKAGVINGFDATTEAAVTKLMVLLAAGDTLQETSRKFTSQIAGEFTVPSILGRLPLVRS